MESTQRHIFILTTAIFMLAVNGGLCQSDAEKVPGIDKYRNVLGVGRFLLHQESVTYEEAVKLCAGEEAYLAMPTSKEIHDVLVEILQTAKVDRALVGITDIAEEGEMVTSKGELYSKVGYSHWKFGEPNDNNGEDCTVLSWDGLLNDVSCVNPTVPFLCEKYHLMPHNPY